MNDSLFASDLSSAALLAMCLLLNEVLLASCKKFICSSEFIQTWRCLAESELGSLFELRVRVSPEAMSERTSKAVLVLAEIRVGSCEQSSPCCASFRGHALALQQS